MNNVSHKKSWNLGMAQVHVEPPTIPLIKVKYDGKSEKYFVQLKFCRDTTSSTLDLYKFKMSLFDNGDSEDFLLFVRNFNKTLAVSGTLETGSKVQYICTLFRVEALRQFEFLSADAESTEPPTVE